MARDVTIRITFGTELTDERGTAEIFAELGMNCEGAEFVVCTVGHARVTQADLTDDFWESRCTRDDIHVTGADEEGAQE